MINSEEWEEIVESFQPKTPEQKRKEVEAETKRLQLPLPDMIIRNAPTHQLSDKKNTSTTKGS